MATITYCGRVSLGIAGFAGSGSALRCHVSQMKTT